MGNPPRHDPPPRRKPVGRRPSISRPIAARPRPRPGKRPEDEGGEGMPVTPDRPLDLSGGATAALKVDG